MMVATTASSLNALDRRSIDAVMVSINRLREFDAMVAAVQRGGNVYLHGSVVTIDPFHLDALRLASVR